MSLSAIPQYSSRILRRWCRARVLAFGNYLREQFSTAFLLYATQLGHPGRVQFLGMPSGAEAGLAKRATYTAATSLRETTVGAISVPLHAASVATRYAVAQIFVKATARKTKNVG